MFGLGLFSNRLLGSEARFCHLGSKAISNKKAALAIRIGFYNAGYLMGFWCELSACDDIKEPFCNALGPEAQIVASDEYELVSRGFGVLGFISGVPPTP